MPGGYAWPEHHSGKHVPGLAHGPGGEPPCFPGRFADCWQHSYREQRNPDPNNSTQAGRNRCSDSCAHAYTITYPCAYTITYTITYPYTITHADTHTDTQAFTCPH
ncbi:hypothetical protein KTAU_27770 [Thermogemmatispora aurantia]|nr:hypothetical protein KTAU_27770 [Thermogemmatispora aurantia]